MSSTNLPLLPPAISLTGTELVWINFAGDDYRITVGQIASLAVPNAFVPTLVTSSGVNLFARGMFSVKTGLGAFVGTLPKLATVPLATPVWVQDIDNNAGTNNYTVDAFAGDSIVIDGVSGSTAPLNVNSSILLFLANTTAWACLRFGF
jgi:hypothetical protein